MISKRGTNKLKAIFLAIFMIFAAGAAVSAFFSDNARELKSADAEIISDVKDVYLLGETFTVGDAEISYKGKTYSSAKSALVFPDGEAYSAGTYTLNETGNYTLKYSFRSEDGGYRVAEKGFCVRQLLYGVSSDLSSFEYTDECPHYPKTDYYTAPWQSLVRNENGETDYANSVLPAALTVKLAEGDEFFYNAPVKLNPDTINALVHFYTPQYNENYVAERIIIRITDCYDSSNYIDIVNEYSQATDFRTALPGTISRYMTKGDRMNVDYDRSYIDGVSYVSRKEEDWGPELVASSNNPTVFVRDVTVGFNYDNGWTYMLNAIDEWVTIIDTTNEDFFGEKAFKGFTSDCVYISVRGENYVKSELLELSFMSIADVSGERLKVTNYFDNQEPEITVDYKETDENGVYIVKDKEFSVFNATATDVNLSGGVTSEVFYASSGVQVAVDCVDNKFTPKAIGEYDVVYSAMDKYGNVAKKTIKLMCVETPDGKAASISTNNPVQVNVGEDVVIPMPQVKSLNGNRKIVATVKSPGGKIYDVDFVSPIIPEEAGDYTLTYSYGDLYYEYYYEETFKAVRSEVVRFIEKPVLPEYLMAGKRYSIDALSVYDFSGTATAVKESIAAVSYDGGDYNVINVKDFGVDAGASKARFRFSYDGVQDYYSEEIPVVYVGGKSAVEAEKYFAGNFDSEALSDGIVFTAKDTDGSATLEYINKTIINGFELKFKLLERYDNFESFNIVFTDYYDRQNKVKLSFSKNNGAMFFSINGGKTYHVRDYYSSDTENVSVSYNPLTESFGFGGLIKYPFRHNFKTGYCLISFELENITGQSKILLQQLLNQSLNSVSRDTSGPVVSYVSEINTAKLGERFVIERAWIADVLSGVVDTDISLIVTDPQGNIVKSTDNVLLDGTCPTNRSYEILLEKAGNYSILYDATDTGGRKTNSPGWLSLTVIADEEAPEITIENNKEAEEVTVTFGKGHSVKLDVSDNSTEKQNLVVSVAIFNEAQGNYVYHNLLTYENGKWEESIFVANQKGKYSVYIYAYDEVGNISVKTYSLIVK